MFDTYFVEPLYNLFVFLIGIMPWGDVGFAIIVLTIIVRAVFYPAFTSSIRLQMSMAAVQADLDAINTKYKDNATERAKQTMALYKERNIRPLAGFVAILVQIPIFIALYFAFFNEGLPNIATDMLYSFVKAPEQVNLIFLGFLDLMKAHNIPLAVVVGFLQYLVVRLSITRTNSASTAALSPEKARAQALQQNLMLYAMPSLYAVIAYTLPAAAGLYFGAMNLISLGQEIIIKRQLQRHK